MIIELLDKRIKEMKDLQRLRLKKQNQEKQAATDAKYKDLVSRIDSYIKVYGFLTNSLNFNPSTELKENSKALLIELQDAIKDGDADAEIVNSADKNFKTVLKTVATEWEQYYKILTSNTTNSLKIIGGIDSEKVKSCLADIKAADKWILDEQIYIKLKNALDVANALIKSLEMEPPIITFLTKMTSGKATIADLDESILAWITKEDIGKKIKLSFVSK